MARVSDAEFLRAFGERVRGERARRGMSRKLLADHAGISERYITQLESGKGNASILVLRQIASALGIPLTRLVQDEKVSAEMTLIRQFLARLPANQLAEAYGALTRLFDAESKTSRANRIALIGLRGGGKTTLGAALSRKLEVPFIELDREVERLAGTSIGALLDLYGQPAYRRYELQALQDLIEKHPSFVVATGGSIVSEPAAYELLLRHCITIWVRTTPEQHMSRVIAQGDLRPMAGSTQAMDDLRRILAERSPLYARADFEIDTTDATENETVSEVLRRLRQAGTEL